MTAPPLADIKAANAKLNDGRFALISLSRPLGPYLAWVAIRVGLTPRQVNYFAMALAFFILGIVSMGSPAARTIGVSLVFLWQVVDVTDGTMARALKIRDNFGGFVDFATGMVVATFLPFCLGVGACLHPDGSLAALLTRFGVEVARPEILVLIAAGMTSVISLYVRLISRVLLIRFGESVNGIQAMRERRNETNWFATFGRNLEALGGLQAFVFFTGALLGQLEVVLVGYAVFYAMILVAFAASTHRSYRNR
ncbi:hypothetical protein K8I85_07615, partial [bacterium]|nr:hypothetical protein [bacterium]